MKDEGGRSRRIKVRGGRSRRMKDEGELKLISVIF